MSSQDSRQQFTRLTGEAFAARAADLPGGFIANIFIVRAPGWMSGGGRPA